MKNIIDAIGFSTDSEINGSVLKSHIALVLAAFWLHGKKAPKLKKFIEDIQPPSPAILLSSTYLLHFTYIIMHEL